MKEQIRKRGGEVRMVGLDLIRVIAIFSVIAGHFFVLNTPFRETVFEASGLFFQGMFYLLFNATGVPLFIMMTGFLNVHKTECNRKYYRGGIRVIIAYLFFAIISILFRNYWLDENLSWFRWGLKILDFSAIPYGWYIEMWIGLYLLTPFLNLMYKAIPTKRQKQVLLVTLFILTAIPDFFNRYGYHLVPGFWQQVFPLTFFFIGSYIREYEPQLTGKKIWTAIAVITLVCAINPIFNMLFVKNHTMIQIARTKRHIRYNSCRIDIHSLIQSRYQEAHNSKCIEAHFIAFAGHVSVLLYF